MVEYLLGAPVNQKQTDIGQEKAYGGTEPACALCGQSPEERRSSEAHADPPRVVRQHLVLLLHDAGVHAFVDGVGHDGDVVAL